MGTRLIGGEFQHKSADEIIATHVYAAFADDIGGTEQTQAILFFILCHFLGDF